MVNQSTSDYYKKNPAARKRRLKQQAKFNSTDLQIKKRTQYNKTNRDNGTYGNGDHKDWAHKEGGGVVAQAEGENRKYNGSGKRGRYSA